MEQIKKTITEENSFFAKRTSSSISQYKECIDKYSAEIEKEVSLKTKTLIFLDTNVLLRYYSISFTAREKLFEFLVTNKKRIVVTPQIQIEFIRNREDSIQKFFEQVTSKIPQDFNTDIVNKMKSFSEQNKVVLKDYPFVERGIEEYQAKLEALLKKLNTEVEKKKREHLDLIFKDNLLDFLATCNPCDGLTAEELTLIKRHFDLLTKDINAETVDSLIKKPNGAFPGLGDIKNKPEDPYGDYIIFHEIMKFMMNQNADVIFLTFDNTKGDWMNKNKTPHLHYIQNIYCNTGRILYILDAERSFGELLNINVDSLVSTNEEIPLNSITAESLMKFALHSPIFDGAKIVPFEDRFIQELQTNGYKYMSEIERDMNKVAYAILQYRKKYTVLNSIGIIRGGLRIANRNYKFQVNSLDGSIIKIPQESLDEYKKLSELSEN
jgi:predicted nucleic acid-binding protein